MKKYTVTDEWKGSRLDRFVRSILPHLSFPAAQALVRRKDVLLNGKKADGAARLSEGDVVEIRFQDAAHKPVTPEEKTGHARPPGEDRRDGRQGGMRPGSPAAENRTAVHARELAQKFGLLGAGIPIIFEDDHILAIDKPAGLPVQPGNRKELGSLLDLLEMYRAAGKGRRGRGRAAARSREGRPADEGADSFPFTPAHRLDSATSGLLLIAKTRRAARALSEALKEGAVEKKYLAVVEGSPRDKSGRIDSRLETRKGAESTSVISRDGKEAVTVYKVLKSTSRGRSMLEIRISTGRTHQIRAHMASIGNPVAGDRKYGTFATASAKDPGKVDRPPGQDLPRPGRLMLHSWKIAFTHPETGERVRLTAAPPGDFVL